MSSLRDFKAAVEERGASQPDFRPFICNGSPYNCEFFIVGFNPATKLCEPFWSFWKDEYGFDKELWFKRYKLERRKRGKRLEVTPTRLRINRILSGASPIKVLEANIYTSPTSTQGEL